MRPSGPILLISLKGKENLVTEIHREDGHVKKTEADTELGYHQLRNAWGYQKLKELRKDPLLEALEDVWSCQYFNFGLLYLEL